MQGSDRQTLLYFCSVQWSLCVGAVCYCAVFVYLHRC
uniref:Uncharacterized protein n=1 Tax=Anguilla anguilla TaxID=7936 RepID=A0A0E9TLM7_ANGAN